MEAIASQIAAEGDATQYVTEADWIPDFWNFLLGLDRNDLIAELVQNDLDQGAKQTVIAFEQERVVCQGNGQPVDADGWLRLRKIRGAGDRVPAKRGKIGVKNHGLKTAFTIGDEVRVLSDGFGITQTLYANGWGRGRCGISGSGTNRNGRDARRSLRDISDDVCLAGQHTSISTPSTRSNAPSHRTAEIKLNVIPFCYLPMR